MLVSRMKRQSRRNYGNSMLDNNQNKLDVAVITHAFYSKLGEIFPSSLLKIIEPSVNEIFVISGNFEPEGLLSNERIHLRNVKPVKEDQLWFIKILKYIPTQLKMCLNLAKISSNIDIVIFAQGSTWLTFPLLFVKFLRKTVIIVVMGSTSKIAGKTFSNTSFGKGEFLFSNIFRLLAKISYVLSDKIVVITESLIQHCELEKFRNKVSICNYYYIDDIFRIKKDFNRRGNLVGYIGRLSEEKGVLELVKAIPLILAKKKEGRFLIAGDGTMMSEMKIELEKTGCKNKVDFVGQIPHEQVADYFNEFKFHILPSYTEAGSGATLEAMACGAITIANSVGGIPDIITDYETGFLLKDNQPQTIADKVIEVWDYPELDKIQKNAREFVKQNFCYEKAVESWRGVLNNW